MPRSAGDISFEVKGGKDLERIARELREVGNGREIRKRLTREIRRELAPAVLAVRREIAAIPTKGEGSSGLRQRMARATRLQVRTAGRDAGATIRVDGRKMPDGQRRLPSYMEGKAKKPWRHPVYGNRAVWAVQPAHPYFFRVVEPFGVRARVGVQRVADAIARDIT